MMTKTAIGNFPCIGSVSLDIEGVSHIRSGKVRELYQYGDRFIMITTDRISAFDIIMPFLVPYKGAILTGISYFFLKKAGEIMPVWVKSLPHPNVMIGKRCTPIKIEVIVRGYIAGSMWRKYKSGQRNFCGNVLPNGLSENDPLPHPIITPTTKSDEGHDEDITPQEIIERGILTKDQYEKIEDYALKLFKQGEEYAKSRGLILVDTKYEFGYQEDGTITLIDEVHTPDSSRYFYLDEYEYRKKNNLPQKHLSKEFLREFLMKHNITDRESVERGDFPPDLPLRIFEVYKELYETLMGEHFTPPYTTSPSKDIENAIKRELKICD